MNNLGKHAAQYPYWQYLDKIYQKLQVVAYLLLNDNLARYIINKINNCLNPL